MWFGVITLFPEMFSTLRAGGVTARAEAKKIVEWALVNPRDFALDIHKTVDDRPYGGGPGMVLKPEPLHHALRVARLRAPEPPKVIYLSASGRPLTQRKVRELAALPSLVLVSGRYEGIDQRFIDAEVDEEISIGDYVLSGGELPAMVLIDAITRLLPGVLSDPRSADLDSFSHEKVVLDWPHYTRPENFLGRKVPKVLLSGDHAAIARWREQKATERMQSHRPDLMTEVYTQSE